MHKPLPPLNALRAFEAAARHSSLTKAAAELHVTTGALSHQIRGLEELLGLKLFNRGVRSISLTAEGKALYPGLKQGFGQIREAVDAVRDRNDYCVLVISTPPGFTAKWLAPRLYKLSLAHPDIDVRISSSMRLVEFATDGVDLAVRSRPTDAPDDPAVSLDKLIDLAYVPVCSPRLIETMGPFVRAADLRGVPLIHDESQGGTQGWGAWFRAAGVDNASIERGIRFDSADHALDAVVEGAGVLLAHDVLAYDDLRTGRLVVPVPLSLPSGRAYYVASPKAQRTRPNVEAFRTWIKAEIMALDWATCVSCRKS